MKEGEDKQKAEAKEAEKEEAEVENNPDKEVDADKIADKNEKLLKDKAVVEHEKKAVDKMAKKVA